MKTDAVFTSKADSQRSRSNRCSAGSGAMIDPMRARVPLGVTITGGHAGADLQRPRGSRTRLHARGLGWARPAWLITAAAHLPLGSAHAAASCPSRCSRASVAWPAPLATSGSISACRADRGAGPDVCFLRRRVARGGSMSRRAWCWRASWRSKRAGACCAAAAFHRSVQLHRVTAGWAGPMGRTRTLYGAERHLVYPLYGTLFGLQWTHTPNRLMGRCSRTQLSPGRPEHRHQRLRLQGDRRALADRGGGARLGTPPSCAGSTRSRRSPSRSVPVIVVYGVGGGPQRPVDARAPDGGVYVLLRRPRGPVGR